MQNAIQTDGGVSLAGVDPAELADCEQEAMDSPEARDASVAGAPYLEDSMPEPQTVSTGSNWVGF